MNEISGIEVYAVGLGRDLRTWRKRFFRRKYRKGATKSFFYSFGIHWHRRSYWNGYLAEWHYPPYGMNFFRAGTGWTKRAAKRRLGKHIVKNNLIKR